MFNNRESLFPITKSHIFLSHSSVSPLYGPACDKLQEIAENHKNKGIISVGEEYEKNLNELRTAAASLFQSPVARVRPSGLKATVWTGSRCPVRVMAVCPSRCQRVTFLSLLAEASMEPAGLKARSWTTSPCRPRRMGWRVDMSQS